MRKAIIIVGVVLTVVGLVIIAAIGGANGLQGLKGMFSHDLSAVDAVEEVQMSSDFVTLNITANSYSVYLRKSADEKMHVKYVSQLPDGVILDVEKSSDNSVTVTQNDADKIWGIMFGSAYQNRFLVVEIPENAHFALSVQCNAGKLDVSGVKNLQKLMRDAGIEVLSNGNDIVIANDRLIVFLSTRETQKELCFNCPTDVYDDRTGEFIAKCERYTFKPIRLGEVRWLFIGKSADIWRNYRNKHY